jgi:transposase
LPNSNTENFNLYLKEFSDYLKLLNIKAILVLDGAGWHKSKDLVVPDNVEFIFLPPYSPDLNPAEKLWQYIKRHTIKNKVFKELEDIEKILCEFIKGLDNDIYRSVCKAKYLIDT